MGELVSLSACSLFRRAGDQVWFEEARGLSPRGNLPKAFAKSPLGLRPRAQGSLEYIDWKLL